MPPKHKSSAPCPFLLHRDRCIKGTKCDFSYSNLDRKSKEQERFPKPKHLTPCPFLERKGNCLKGSKCDFFHKSNHFQQHHHLKQYENLPFLEPLQSIKSLLEHVELGLQRFNVTGTGFQQTHFNGSEPISTDGDASKPTAIATTYVPSTSPIPFRITQRTNRIKSYEKPPTRSSNRRNLIPICNMGEKLSNSSLPSTLMANVRSLLPKIDELDVIA